MLTEEEAVVGTIVQQTPQPRKRKDHMTKLRDQTDLLVKGIRDKLEGDDGDSPEDVLRRAKEKDAAVAASAAGASYANGENSYRTDEVEDDDASAPETDEDPSGTHER